MGVAWDRSHPDPLPTPRPLPRPPSASRAEVGRRGYPRPFPTSSGATFSSRDPSPEGTAPSASSGPSPQRILSPARRLPSPPLPRAHVGGARERGGARGTDTLHHGPSSLPVAPGGPRRAVTTPLGSGLSEGARQRRRRRRPLWRRGFGPRRRSSPVPRPTFRSASKFGGAAPAPASRCRPAGGPGLFRTVTSRVHSPLDRTLGT